MGDDTVERDKQKDVSTQSKSGPHLYRVQSLSRYTVHLGFPCGYLLGALPKCGLKSNWGVPSSAKTLLVWGKKKKSEGLMQPQSLNPHANREIEAHSRLPLKSATTHM